MSFGPSTLFGSLISAAFFADLGLSSQGLRTRRACFDISICHTGEFGYWLPVLPSISRRSESTSAKPVI